MMEAMLTRLPIHNRLQRSRSWIAGALEPKPPDLQTQRCSQQTPLVFSLVGVTAESEAEHLRSLSELKCSQTTS